MEKSTFSNKRKKRKTRKCLDEIRKRSRRTNERNTSQINVLKNAVTSSSSLVTMNRLTLSIFSKAVQSDTITRPVLAELKQNNNNNVNTIENVAAFSKSSSSEYIHNNLNSPGASGKRANVMEIDINDLNHENDNNQMTENHPTVPTLGSSEGFLFSPEYNSTPKDQPIDINSSSSDSSQSSEEFYEQLINDVSDYCKKCDDVHEDVIKKTKIHLQKLYIENCQKEYEKNILNCIRSNMLSNKSQNSEVMTATPINIINSPVLASESILKECPVSLSDSSECELSPPAIGISSSSSDKIIPHLHDTVTSPELPQSDTPEYIYFPHRLH